MKKKRKEKGRDRGGKGGNFTTDQNTVSYLVHSVSKEAMVIHDPGRKREEDAVVDVLSLIGHCTLALDNCTTTDFTCALESVADELVNSGHDHARSAAVVFATLTGRTFHEGMTVRVPVLSCPACRVFDV